MYILVVQDYISIYVEIFPLQEHCAKTLADILV